MPVSCDGDIAIGDLAEDGVVRRQTGVAFVPVAQFGRWQAFTDHLAHLGNEDVGVGKAVCEQSYDNPLAVVCTDVAGEVVEKLLA